MNNRWRNPSVTDTEFSSPYENIQGFEREEPALTNEGMEWSIWRNSIQDHPAWESFTEGFADENLAALLYGEFTNAERPQSPVFQAGYNYMDDPALEP